MKIFLMTIVFLTSAQFAFGQQEFPMPKPADYPEIKTTGAKTADFVPAGWQVTGEAKGDLNGDKIEDAALAVQGADARFITKNEGLGTTEFDTNPRMLIVLFGTKDGYKLAAQNNSIIAMADYPTMDEPFESIEIARGVLQIKLQMFMNAGGWGMSNHTYKFRFQNAEFALIGADLRNVQRNTGEMTERSYNFMTRKVETKTGSIEHDKTKRTVRAFKVGKLPTLKTFIKPFEYEIEKDIYV